MFEHSLISLDTKRTVGRRWLSLPVAVGLHLAALATFTFASYWHVESVSDPPESGVFIIEAALPGLLPIQKGGGTPPPDGPKPQTPAPAPSDPIQPADTADHVPTLDASASSGPVNDAPVRPGRPDGFDGGVDPSLAGDGPCCGSGKGPIGLIGDGQPKAAPASAPIYMNAAVIRPVLLDGPQPRYTEMARRAGVQGTVIVEAIIDEQGRVTDVRILKALPMGLDQAAVEAVRSWRFKPATLAGRPVKVYYTLTANFTLQR
jgi:protein TonB